MDVQLFNLKCSRLFSTPGYQVKQQQEQQ